MADNTDNVARSPELSLVTRTPEARPAFALDLATDESARARRRLLPAWNRSARARAFTRQAATLLRAGFPLERVLSISETLFSGDGVGLAIAEVRRRVREGEPLAAALGAHPTVFGEFYRGVIGAGERSGRLAEAFERLAGDLERQAELRSRLLGALLYPAIMVAAGSAAVVFLLLFVIPRFAVVLADLGGELPWTARTLVGLGELVSAAWWLLLAIPIGGAGAVALHRRTEAGRLVQDLWLLRVPVLGALRARLATERVARSLAGALAGGIPLLEALDIASGAAADAAYRRELRSAAEAVRRGETLSVALERGGVVPELAVQMIAAGEESGRLTELLEHVTKAYRIETEQQLRTLVAVIEPAIIVVFGALVGFIALALLQTIYGVGATL